MCTCVFSNIICVYVPILLQSFFCWKNFLSCFGLVFLLDFFLFIVNVYHVLKPLQLSLVFVANVFHVLEGLLVLFFAISIIQMLEVFRCLRHYSYVFDTNWALLTFLVCFQLLFMLFTCYLVLFSHWLLLMLCMCYECSSHVTCAVCGAYCISFKY